MNLYLEKKGVLPVLLLCLATCLPVGWAQTPTVPPSTPSTPVAPAPTPLPDLTAHKTKDGILFQYAAPVASADSAATTAPAAGTTVYLAGDFNGWAKNTGGLISDPQFKLDGPDANGLYSKTVHLEPGAHKFKFVVNGTWINPDWAKEHDSEGNGLIYISGAGDVLLVNPVNADWKAASKDGKTTFQLYYPMAQSVYLAGDFNAWGNVKNEVVSDRSCAMQGPDANGVWNLTVALSPGPHSYKFVINGNAWEIDPNADKPDAQGNSPIDVAK